MSDIESAKRAFGEAIEVELDRFAKDIVGIVAKAREAAKDSSGLNDLAASFNGLASTLEHAATQVEDTRAEVRTWLGTDKPKITERVNTQLLAEIQREHVA